MGRKRRKVNDGQVGEGYVFSQAALLVIDLGKIRFSVSGHMDVMDRMLRCSWCEKVKQ
jgi:hypothetical protein